MKVEELLKRLKEEKEECARIQKRIDELDVDPSTSGHKKDYIRIDKLRIHWSWKQDIIRLLEAILTNGIEKEETK